MGWDEVDNFGRGKVQGLEAVARDDGFGLKQGVQGQDKIYKCVVQQDRRASDTHCTRATWASAYWARAYVMIANRVPMSHLGYSIDTAGETVSSEYHGDSADSARVRNHQLIK